MFGLETVVVGGWCVEATRGLRVSSPTVLATIYKKKRRETSGERERTSGRGVLGVPQECWARNSAETRGDTCRLEAKYIEIAESTRAFRAPGLCLSSSLRPLLSRESSRLFLPFSRNLDEVARFSSCATLVNVTAAATLGEPQCPPQKSSLPRAHNGPRSSRGDRFLDSRQWGPVHPNFSLSLLSLSFSFFLLFLRPSLAFLPFFVVSAYEQNSGRGPTDEQFCLRSRRGKRNWRYSRCSRSTRRDPVRWYRRGCFDRLDDHSRTAPEVNTSVSRPCRDQSRSNRPLCTLKSDQR